MANNIKKVKLKDASNDYLYPKTKASIVVNDNDVPITTSFESGTINATTSLKKNGVEVATASDLSGYQRTLTAGTGIDITGQTISVDASELELDSYVQKNDIDRSVVNGKPTFTVNGDTVTETLPTVNLKTGVTGTTAGTVIPLADSNGAGLMSPDDVSAIAQLQDDVAALQGQTVRLIYTASQSPTASQINQFVLDAGYSVSQFSGIAVVVSGTYHIWHYYSNSGAWQDDGQDTVSQFTNNTAGIIKGSTTAGKVYAENDGTGSVNGWSALQTSVSNNATSIANITNGTTKVGNADKLDGNDSSYFASVSLVGTKANDSAVVHKTGDETISGSKSFTSGVTFYGSIAYFLNNGKITYLDSQSGSGITIDKPSSITANRTLTLPDKSGTLATTSDIPSVAGFVTYEEIE